MSSKGVCRRPETWQKVTSVRSVFGRPLGGKQNRAISVEWSEAGLHRLGFSRLWRSLLLDVASA